VCIGVLHASAIDDASLRMANAIAGNHNKKLHVPIDVMSVITRLYRGKI
jgi:allophanate hydrolase subunit 2